MTIPDNSAEVVAWLIHDKDDLGDYLTKSRFAAENSDLPHEPLVRLSDYENLRKRLAEAEGGHAAARQNFLTMQGAANELRLRAEKAEARLKAMEEALTPSGATKAAYIGEWYEVVEHYNPAYEDDESEPETVKQYVPVSWTTIKEIMAAIRAQALSSLTPEPSDG